MDEYDYESMTPAEWYNMLIAEGEYADLVDCVMDAGEDGLKNFYEAVLGDCDGPYVSRMAEIDVALFAVSRGVEVLSLLELERFVACERPDRVSEFPSMLEMMCEDMNVYVEDVVEWAESLERAVRRGTPEAAARRIRELCAPVVSQINDPATAATTTTADSASCSAIPPPPLCVSPDS